MLSPLWERGRRRLTFPDRTRPTSAGCGIRKQKLSRSSFKEMDTSCAELFAQETFPSEQYGKAPGPTAIWGLLKSGETNKSTFYIPVPCQAMPKRWFQSNSARTTRNWLAVRAIRLCVCGTLSHRLHISRVKVRLTQCSSNIIEWFIAVTVQ